LGNWLSVFKEYGVEEILGVDGDYIDLDLLKIPQKYFLQHDLKKPLKVEQHFDLVVSLEVAEHLPSESAENFVILLSAWDLSSFFQQPFLISLEIHI
jgi:2-polyprenyl-3-methyl-5-hydroxy-6-metoxy-1,4-benzoquinol methylase